MCNKPGDEIHDGEGHGFNSVGIMVQKSISDAVAVKGLDSGFRNGRSFEISAEIEDVGGGVIRLFVKMDNPCFFIEQSSPGAEFSI